MGNFQSSGSLQADTSKKQINKNPESSHQKLGHYLVLSEKKRNFLFSLGKNRKCQLLYY